ncbi:MAG TPA: hypothetical protein VHD33_02450 [Legionellaceae bacterium]|nr:hypothetical protein [Legionellaceae bacterium]
MDMDFQNDLKTVPDTDLLEAIKISERELANHLGTAYEPQKRRLHVWNLAQMGDRLYFKNHYTEALNYYTQAKQFDCDEPSVLNQIGICLIHLGKIERALQYFDLLSRRVVSTTEKALAWYNMSYCYQISNLLNDAVLALKKSLKFDNNEASAKELATLKERISMKQFTTFKQNLFNKVVLAKEEIRDSQTKISETRSGNPTTQYKDYVSNMFKKTPINEDAERTSTSDITMGN